MATINREPNQRISNLSQYLYLKEVRANTSLIDGKIIYGGKEWTKEEYEAAHPEPKLEYDIVRLDSKQIPK